MRKEGSEGARSPPEEESRKEKGRQEGFEGQVIQAAAACLASSWLGQAHGGTVGLWRAGSQGTRAP